MIKHHLKDGRIIEDITGHVVKKEDAPMAYSLIDQLNDERKKGRRGKND